MALIKTNMALVGSGGGNGVYIYRTADLKATVAAANYFDGLAATLNVGDVIHVISGIGGTVVGSPFYVTANTGTVVTIAAPA
jgi:hypothetical protein